MHKKINKMKKEWLCSCYWRNRNIKHSHKHAKQKAQNKAADLGHTKGIHLPGRPFAKRRWIAELLNGGYGCWQQQVHARILSDLRLACRAAAAAHLRLGSAANRDCLVAWLESSRSEINSGFVCLAFLLFSFFWLT